MMADQNGVPEVIGVAPEAPAGQDDIKPAPPSGEGPSKIWEVPEDNNDAR